MRNADHIIHIKIGGKNMKRKLNPMQQNGQICIVTADSQGLPHVASSNDIEFISEQCLEIRCCSSSQTMANLWDNTHILLLLWNVDYPQGLRLKGKLLQIKRMTFHNENTSDINGITDLHMEMELVVRIDEVSEIEPVCHHDKKEPALSFPMYLHHRLF
jgi:hypothetical protein